MFSRIEKIIGAVIILAGFVWVVGVVGADDFATDAMVFGPVVPLLGKLAAGCVAMFGGLAIYKRGCRYE